MNRELDEILTQVAEDTFASMAFILPREEDEPRPEADVRRAVAEVAFSGPFDGRLLLSVDRGMLPAMAANMLGLPDCEPTTVKIQVDALGELLNVICGSLLPQVAGPEVLFHVGAPRVTEDTASPENAAAREPDARIHLALEGGDADLALFANHPVTISEP